MFLPNSRDGIRNNGEVPLAGVTVTLISNGVVIGTAVTNASGLYSFTGLTPGVPYSVSTSTPTGYTTTRPSVTGPFTLTSGENKTIPEVGYSALPRAASVGGGAYTDNNANGVHDGPDAPLAVSGIILTA